MVARCVGFYVRKNRLQRAGPPCLCLSRRCPRPSHTVSRGRSRIHEVEYRPGCPQRKPPQCLFLFRCPLHQLWALSKLCVEPRVRLEFWRGPTAPTSVDRLPLVSRVGAARRNVVHPHACWLDFCWSHIESFPPHNSPIQTFVFPKVLRSITFPFKLFRLHVFVFLAMSTIVSSSVFRHHVQISWLL